MFQFSRSDLHICFYIRVCINWDLIAGNEWYLLKPLCAEFEDFQLWLPSSIKEDYRAQYYYLPLLNPFFIFISMHSQKHF